MYEKFATETLKKLSNPGCLLVSTNKTGRANVMAIGWGLIGMFWSMPVFLIAVRPTRFTYRFLEGNGEFTVNVPREGMEDTVSYCGEVSGRRVDKFAKCKLTLIEAKKVSVPVIKQCRIHYECKVIHKLEVDEQLVPSRVKKTFYPKPDYHTLYFGRIMAAYRSSSR